MKTRNRLFFLVIISAFFCAAARAQIATGGDYALEKSVIANGGAASANGNFTVSGTIGQAAAGTPQQNAPLKFQPGFWTAAPLAPTAAAVSLGGRVLTANGHGIRNVRITLLMPGGETRRAVSSAFGYYCFTEVPAGAIYILNVSAKRYVFAPPTRVINLIEELDDIDFIAEN
ncbi:MAG TPA: carboxypeptidase-like regulatory domain-containing protein [Pyrinomonadaceae bacterium]|jgi:hypothetical protein